MMTRIASVAGPAAALLIYVVTLGGSAPAAAPARSRTRELVEEAHTHLRAGRYQEAVGPLRRLTSAYPRNHVYLGELAGAYQALQQPKAEAAVWEKYVEVTPNPYEACPRFGLAYREQGLQKESLHAFERCLGFAPDDSDMLLFLGLALERSGEDARADELYVKALTVAPGYPDVELGRGRIALRRGQPAVALAGARAVLARGPATADALFVAGLAALRVGDQPAARAYLEQGLGLRDDSDVRLALGMLAEAESHPDEAATHYAAALARDPENRDARQRQARLAHSGDPR